MRVCLDLLPERARGRRWELCIVIGYGRVVEVEVQIPRAYQTIASAGVQDGGVTVDGKAIHAQSMPVYLVRERQDCAISCQQEVFRPGKSIAMLAILAPTYRSLSSAAPFEPFRLRGLGLLKHVIWLRADNDVGSNAEALEST